VDEATYTITQERFLRGSQQFTIKGHTLMVERRRGLSLEQQSFELDGFLPEPLRIRRVPLGRMLMSLLAIASAAGLLTWGLTTSDNDISAVAIFFGLLMAFITPFLAIATCLGFANVVAFRGVFFQHIHVWHGLPDKATFDEFVAALSERIHVARVHGQTIVSELRLANIISSQQYDQAMRLLKEQKDRPQVS